MASNEDDADWTLVTRDRAQSDSLTPHLEMHPLPDGVIVSVKPPATPSTNIHHMPCDIVLVIDISGSMNCDAPVPAENPSEKERNGFTVLDLVKHAARTILETLDESDRLGVVTFSEEGRVIQTLQTMTPNNKTATWNRINSLHTEGRTNLWHGLLKGVELFRDNHNTNSMPAVMILTDGLPNLMCPAQGYVPKLRKQDINASLHTFGFGYSLDSGLLKSIAEFGGGNYAFIPDAGMIGTVFVHAIANLQSTFAPSATLKVSASHGLVLTETVGEKLQNEKPGQLSGPDTQVTIPLGSVQYGQSRDILLQYSNLADVGKSHASVCAELQCQPLDGSQGNLSASCRIDQAANLEPELISYHRSRSLICNFLSTIAPLSDEEKHVPITDAVTCGKRQELEGIIKLMDEAGLQDILNKSLLTDLTGQIRLALMDQYYHRWGQHFLQSIHNAHAKQICNSFKDAGPLQYGTASSLFQKCRDDLDDAFDNLPPPKPSKVPQNGIPHRRVTSMRQYNNADGVCFAAETFVRLANGAKVEARALQKGIMMWTPKGPRKVVAVVATAVQDKEMCMVGGLLITPWHPICISNRWIFPDEVSESTVLYSGAVYSLLLEPDVDDGAHGVEVDGTLAVTLGHGVTSTSESDDKRAHSFFGDHDKVSKSLKDLQQRHGVYWCEGIARDPATNLVTGLLGQPQAAPPRRVLAQRTEVEVA